MSYDDSSFPSLSQLGAPRRTRICLRERVPSTSKIRRSFLRTSPRALSQFRSNSSDIQGHRARHQGLFRPGAYKRRSGSRAHTPRFPGTPPRRRHSRAGSDGRGTCIRGNNNSSPERHSGGSPRRERKPRRDISLPGQNPAACKSRSEEHTSELQSPCNLVCRLLLEKKKKQHAITHTTI